MEKLGLGVVGLGRGFMLTLPALQAHPAVRLVAAFDLRADALLRFAEEFGGEAHTSLERLLADERVDAVYIATPHELHAQQAIAALQSGKHVLVEKPMATSVADCAAMAAAARAAGRVLVVGPSHGFDEQVRLAADLAASGRFGRVRMVTTFNFTDFMYRPRRAEELDSSRGGGVVYSQAAHQIDVVRRLIGQPVASVRAIAGNWDVGRPSEGAYTALMTFTGGAAASLTYSGYAHYDSDELVGWISELGSAKDNSLYGAARRKLDGMDQSAEDSAKLSRTYGGSRGVAAHPAHHEHFGFVIVSCERADLKLLPTGIEIYGDEERSFVPIPPPTIPRAAVIDEFVGAIRGDRVAVHDGSWGLVTMACCDAILQSSRKSAEIDPMTIISAPTA